MAKGEIRYRYFLKEPKDTLVSDSIGVSEDTLITKLSVMPRKERNPDDSNVPVGLFRVNGDSVLQNHQEFKLICVNKGQSGHQKFDGLQMPIGLSDTLAIQGVLLLCIALTVFSFFVGRNFYDYYCFRFLNFKERANLNIGKRKFETEAKVALFVQSLLLKGILFYNLMRVVSGDEFLYDDFNTGVLFFVGIFLVYYLVKLLIFYLLGSLFSTMRDLRTFLSDYFSLLSVEGLLLLFPTIAMIFFELDERIILGWVALTVFVVAILLIMSGVKIFFKNYRGFFYILLYLCALEVYPVIVLYQVLNYCYQNL